MSKILGSISSTARGAKCSSLKILDILITPIPLGMELGTWLSAGVLDQHVKVLGFNSHYQKANKRRLTKPQPFGKRLS